MIFFFVPAMQTCKNGACFLNISRNSELCVSAYCLPSFQRDFFFLFLNLFTAGLIIPHEYVFTELYWSLFNLRRKCGGREGHACPHFNSRSTEGGLVRHAELFRAMRTI